MSETQNQGVKAKTGARRLWDFAVRSGLRPTYFIVPVVLGFGAALFEGINVFLLLQLSRGVLGMYFLFVRDVSGLKQIFDFIGRFMKVSAPVIFVLLLTLLFITSLLKNIFQYLSSMSADYQVRVFSNNLRKMLFDRIVTFGKLYFDQVNSGYLHGVLMNFTSVVASRLIEMQQLFSWFFMLGVYLVMMLRISHKMTFLVLLLLPILHYSLGFIIDRIRSNSQSYADSQSDLSRAIFNILSCVLLVKTYRMEDAEKERFATISDQVASLEYRIDKKVTLIGPIQETAVLSMILFLIAVTAFITRTQGPSRISGLLVYFYLLKRASTAIGVLNSMRAAMASISGPIDEILDLLDDEGKFFVDDGRVPFRRFERAIEFKSLNYGFAGRTKVLRNIDFAIEKGKMTAIVGPSGSGKTTLINLLLRFYDPPPGQIFIDGTDIREFMLKSYRRSIALVSQDTLLFNDTLRKNIAYGLNGEVTDEKLMEAIRKARLHDFVMKLPKGLESPIGDRGIQLSGGERQRVSIARALLKGAEVLILDEATSSLDTKTEKLIQEAVEEMIQDKTAVVIAHRLSTIKKADKIVVVENGSVLESGSLQELLDRKGKFYQYWEEQKFS